LRKENGEDLMRIAVTSKGTDLQSEVDPRFGRASYIAIVDSVTGNFEVLDNRENANALKGTGIQAAKLVAEKGAKVLITGHCGPNAFRALNSAGIGVANNATGTINEAVAEYTEGKLRLSEEPDVEGHW
jgi:predicted Fe-Mo cluster-binding NifX family protein